MNHTKLITGDCHRAIERMRRSLMLWERRQTSVFDGDVDVALALTGKIRIMLAKLEETIASFDQMTEI